MINTTPTRWFFRGFLVGLLICGALNAVSYFPRSDGWGDLLGTRPEHAESLGFPWLLWEEGNSYGGYYVDYRALLSNALVAALVGSLCGAIMVIYRERFNRLVEELEHAFSGPQDNFHFSIRGLLLATCLAATFAAMERHLLAARPEVLGAIYVLGPLILVSITMLPRGIPWQQRVVILVPATVLMILAAIFAGASLRHSLEFDRVMMGIFVCWTPQCVLAAIVLSLLLPRKYW